MPSIPRASIADLGRIGRQLMRLLKNRDGAQSLEFALTAIPLFLFLFGVGEFARLYWVQSDLQFAAEAAARYVTINPSATTSTVQTYAASQVTSVSVPTSDFTVTAYSSSTNTPNCGNQVTVSYQFSFMIGELFPYGPITLNAEGCHNG
jgi:Flp pilus assembly protein TadG